MVPFKLTGWKAIKPQ